MSKKPQYWVVGATWNGEDMIETFIKRGYWQCGYDPGDVSKYDDRLEKIEEGDRIAVKSILGPGNSKIRIRAIGIIKDIDEDKTVYVNWILTNIDRLVPSRGCYGTIHGPFILRYDRDWINKVFRI